jgi:hypothetical protein
MRAARHFRTDRHGRIVLHSATDLVEAWEPLTLISQCETELARLEKRFGFRLRGRVIVYFFARHQQIAAIFGARYAGAALPNANAIVIPENQNIVEFMRHELAHLLSARWNQYAPCLLSEGLSVWLQKTQSHRPIDEVARPFFDDGELRLPRLLSSKFFFDEPHRHACYMLAGSFTGFLIRRHGWDRYRKWYRGCDGWLFGMKFRWRFGVSFAKAEWQWRNEITITDLLRRRSWRNIRS